MKKKINNNNNNINNESDSIENDQFSTPRINKVTLLLIHCFIRSPYSSTSATTSTSTATTTTSVLFSLFSATSVFAAILFYFVHGERLKKNHIMGIAFMIVSVVFIANSQDKNAP
jgi:drug/metabolite transporter (DMT)-like permease